MLSLGGPTFKKKKENLFTRAVFRIIVSLLVENSSHKLLVLHPISEWSSAMIPNEEVWNKWGDIMWKVLGCVNYSIGERQSCFRNCKFWFLDQQMGRQNSLKITPANLSSLSQSNTIFYMYILYNKYKYEITQHEKIIYYNNYYYIT